MNAPLPESIRRALETVSLDDKYKLENGRAFMSGVQALVRLPMLQRKRDAFAGLNTAGFVSGYRGSPLGGYDQALWQAKKHLAAQNIVFQPGVNEELAATALWGTQQIDLFPATKKFDGVFGIWYGKGPGVDRCFAVPAMLACLNTSEQRSTPGPLPYQMPNTPSNFFDCGYRSSCCVPHTAVAPSSSFTPGWNTMCCAARCFFALHRAWS